MESIVNERSGSVLGKGSILKMYFFPGQRTSSRLQINGAPHVYKVGFKEMRFLCGFLITGNRKMIILNHDITFISGR